MHGQLVIKLSIYSVVHLSVCNVLAAAFGRLPKNISIEHCLLPLCLIEIYACLPVGAQAFDRFAVLCRSLLRFALCLIVRADDMLPDNVNVVLLLLFVR